MEKIASEEPADPGTEEEPGGTARAGGRGGLLAALLVCAALTAYWTAGMVAAAGWGWDETMHAEMPAVRMLFEAQDGDLGEAAAALLACDRYPFVYPLILAAAQAIGGASEAAARATGNVMLGFALAGLFLLGRRLAREAGPRARWAAGTALALGATCPLALAYSGTVFLEVPFLCVMVWTLLAWLRRRDAAHPRRADLLAGALVTACFFTKFNYGVLLGAGLALDALIDLAAGARRGAAGRELRRVAWTVAPFVLACLWWFVLPLPEGFARAAHHRDAFSAFLGGNQAFGRSPDTLRLLSLAGFFSFTPRALCVLVLGLLASLAFLRRAPGARSLWLVGLTFAAPIAWHNFFLDRFLIPVGAALWPLSALGIAALLPTRRALRWTAAAALALFAYLPFPNDTAWLAARCGLLSEDPGVRAYQEGIFAEWRDLSADRRLRSAGLRVEEAAAFLDIVSVEVGPEERVGWLGMSAEIGPFGLLFGLWERGGSRERLLRDAHRKIYVALESVDPEWTDEELLRFAERFDVLLATSPPDIRDRVDRRFLRSYQERLVQQHGWTYKRIGQVDVWRALNEPRRVDILVLRPAPR